MTFLTECNTMVDGQPNSLNARTRIDALGEPLSVHPPAKWRRTLDKFSDPGRTVPWLLAGLFLFVAAVLFQQYLGGAWGQGGALMALPIGGAVCLLLAIGSIAYGVRALKKPVKFVPRPTFTFYMDALAVETGDSLDLLYWADVNELLAPAMTGTTFRLVANDGRQIDLVRSVEDEGRLIQSTIARVTAEKLPAALAALSAGQTLIFRDLGIRREGLTYKTNKLNWPNVKSMVLMVCSGKSMLSVKETGALFPWCLLDLNEFPNNQLFYDLLVRTAPPHLLKEAKPGLRGLNYKAASLAPHSAPGPRQDVSHVQPPAR